MFIWYYLDTVDDKVPVHGQELSRCIPALAKKHVFGSAGMVAGIDCQTLACALDFMVLRSQPYITARRYGEVVLPDTSTGHLSWYFSQKTVTVQGGYGALFAVRVQVLLSITRVAVQI